jgi:hypothetical protein
MKKLFTLGLAIVLMASVGVFAQTATGNVQGVVTDASGAVLPGASVTISGEAGTRTTVSGADGAYRFLNMDYGDYKITFSLQGFSTANRNVTVVTGNTATVSASLKVGGLTDTVNVTDEAPLVDVTKRGTGTSITNEQLNDVPNSRDPWGVLRNVPGAMIDRVNIAGNENGQQASIAGKGSTTSDVVWNLDGLVITDMAATGASPTYFDFGAFQEINVSTGGGDLTMQTGGFGLGFVTKRGTNTFHGGGRFFNTDEKFGSSNISPELLADINKGGTANRLAGGVGYCADPSGVRDKGDHVNAIKDYGFDIGGPIVKDKLWFYATYGKQDIKNCRLNGTTDATLLPSYNAKLNWQANADTMVSLYYFVGKKQKFGRAVGFFANEADTFLWNQDNAYTDGGLPGGLSKLEVNHTFSANFFASVKAAYYDTGFTLAARGGDTQGFTLDFDNARATGSYVTYVGRRPQKTVNADASYFFEGLGGNNQLKFGFGYRIATTNDTSHYNGNQLGGVVAGGPYAAYVLRDSADKNEGRYLSGYVGDVLTKDRLTLNLGVRFDAQSAKNLASTIPANKSLPALAPAVNYAGDSDNLVDWKDISPRAGFSYALNESRKTVVRGSYANYASQLSYGIVKAAAVPAGYLAYGWNDTNGDRFVQPNEVDVAGGVLYTYNIDPSNRTGISPGRIDPDMKAQRDNEFVVGIDHELASNFAVGAAYTFRKSKNLQYTPFRSSACAVGATCSFIQPNQYTRATDVTNRGFTVQRYNANATLVGAGGNGRYRKNFEGYTRQYSGFEVTAKKRLSNKWAFNLAFAMNDWTEDYADDNRVNAFGNPTRRETNALVDGGPVSILSGGSGKASFYSSFKWQVYADALVDLPASFSLSAALFGRQGGIYPTNITTGLGSDGNTPVLAVADLESARYDNLWNLDLRLHRNAKIGRVTMTPSVELFNALNNDVVLGRARNAASSAYGRVEEVISPRILRIGVRVSF